MPTIICPKCHGKLRFPEGSPARRVKCPTCGSVFNSDEAGKPAGLSGSREVPKARDSKDFELPMDDDRDRGSRRRDDDDDDRGRRRDRYDDDDDRGRARRRDRYDDEDDRDRDRGRRRDRYDDDDRDRGRSRDRYDDDDDYDRNRGRRKKIDERAIEGQFNRASLCCLLNFIAGWLAVAAFGLMAFVVFLDWCGIQEGLRIFTVLAGLLGLGYWLTSATGLGFLVSGPRDRGALGLSIATAGVAGLHLMLIIISATTRGMGDFSGPNTPRNSEVSWAAFISQATALPILLFLEIAFSDVKVKISENAFLPVVTNLLEVGRMILMLLTLKAVMLCARDKKGASTCMKAMIGYAISAGGLILFGILFGLMMLAMRPDNRAAGNLQTMSAIIHLFFLILYLVLAGLMVGVTLVVRTVKGKIDYRP